MRRRQLLGGAAAASGLALAGCDRAADRLAANIPGGWVGAAVERGHRLREAPRAVDPATPTLRCAVAIVGGGVAGLAAARALSRAGVDDWRLFELEDQPGGNARGHTMGGLRCPLGAHYLPLPGPEAREVAELLHELGLARSELGRTVYDERHLAHAPQERLFVAEPGGAASDGRWHEGLLPTDEASPQTLAALRGFAAELRGLRRTLSFAMPTLRSTWSAGLAALDAQTFATWLDGHGHVDPVLRAYLDYACRDDYGASAGMVSAWAGLHYFASRHGFHAPGDADDDDASDGVLTWPEGNAHFTEALAREGGERIAAATLVTRIAPTRHEVELQTWNATAARAERWVAKQAIVCVPLFVAQRLIDPLPAPLAALAPRLAYAPWLVTNLQLRAPLIERQGPPRAWDNVIAGSAALGYVDAGHQSLRAAPGPTVLTHYWALGGQSMAELQAQRARLLGEPWSHWRDAVLADLAPAHPDLAGKTERIASMRYGHAMLIPRPGLRGDPALAALAEPQGRLLFAHADLAGYSVFEEAYTRGTLAGQRASTGA